MGTISIIEVLSGQASLAARPAPLRPRRRARPPASARLALSARPPPPARDARPPPPTLAPSPTPPPPHPAPQEVLPKSLKLLRPFRAFRARLFKRVPRSTRS